MRTHLALALSWVPQALALLTHGQEAQVYRAEAPQHVRLVQGPTLLHAGIQQQWGGHTFSYLLEGPEGVYWSALAGPAGPALVGQSPAPGGSLAPHVTRLDFSALAPRRVDPPLLLRTPEGTLHAFVSIFSAADGRGDVRYLVSARPDDVSAFVDRSESIPRTRFPRFHANRKNVGLDRAGQRAALFVLSDFVEGRSSMNTPLLFVGRIEAGVIRFAEPLVLGEPVPFFYPQIAATDEGPVLLGAVDHDPSRHAELLHVDWEGRVLQRVELPHPEGVSETWAFELEPFDPRDWSRLLIARAIVPAEGHVRWLEFWSYDTRARTLTRLRSLENHLETEPSFTNAGQIWSEAQRGPLFVSEPGSASVSVWEGELAGSQPLRLASVPRTTVVELGFGGVRSLFLASVLHGSTPLTGRRAFALDLDLPCASPGTTGPCAWLVGWLERTP